MNSNDEAQMEAAVVRAREAGDDGADSVLHLNQFAVLDACKLLSPRYDGKSNQEFE